MLKSIKKSVKYLLILIGILILTPSFFYLIIRIPEVQTFIVKRITSHFSDQIKSTITVSRLDFSFFNKLTISDLLIKDVNNDTMIYSKQVVVGIRKLDFRNKIIKLGKAELIEPSLAIITDTSGVMNLKWYLNLLGSSERTGKKSNSLISINQVTISDGRFLLLNKKGSKSNMLIDFNDLRLSGINAGIEDLNIRDDSVLFNVKGLQLTESGGFAVKKMDSQVILAGSNFTFNDLFLNCDSSVINADHIALRADSSDSFSRFINEVSLDFSLQKSLISAADLRYFIPFLKGSKETVGISGKVSGTIAELKGRNINLTYGDISSLDCDFDLSGLPKVEEAFIYVGVQRLKTNSGDISKFRVPGGEKIRLPDVITKLGNIAFNGSFTGFVNDFVAYGKISSDRGGLMVDVSLRPEEKNRFKIKGLIKGSNIDLGELTGKPDLLGRLTMETNLDGYASSDRKLSGNVTGKIDSIEFNKYVYRNVTMNGVFTEKTWDGTINISDKNIKMDLLGMFDFSNVLPEFNFTLNLAESNLYNLHVDKADSTTHLAMLLTANFKGNNIDNLFGEIKMLNSTFEKQNNKLELYDFSLKAFAENNKPAISLRTDFADADLRGYYNFADILNVLKRSLASLIPSRFSAPPRGKEVVKNNFTFACNFKNTDKLTSFFRTGIQLSDKSTLIGSFYPDSVIKVEIKAKSLSFKNNTFTDLTINTNYSDTTLTSDLQSSSLSILGRSELRGFNVGLNANPDNFIFHFDWDNKEKELNKGSFIAKGSIMKKEGSKYGIIMKIAIDSSDLYLRNSLWRIGKSDISIDSNSVSINKFIVGNNQHYYLVDGKVSENPSDTLRLAFKGIDLSPLNNAVEKTGKKDPAAIRLNVQGIINGDLSVSNVFKSPLVESNITVGGFSLLGGKYGDVSISSTWNAGRKVVDLNASNNLNGMRNLDITGIYDPGTKKIRLNAKTTRLPVEALNPLLSFFASNITGTVSGKVNLSGEISKPVLTGALMAENTSMKIDYLQTTYKINDTIRFDESGIKFRNIKLTDEKGKTAILTGLINHRYFKDYAVDLSVTMNDCLVLNTQAKDNEMFYGTAYATGVTTIKSGTNFLSFDISGTTGKNTRVFIPLNSGLSVSEYSFVSFVNLDTLKKRGAKKLNEGPAKANGTSMELNIDVKVTPDSEVQLLIDPKAGDVIKGRGEGDLNINLNREGVFKITGDYIIDQGEYLFTLGNILNKRFDVESGGKITFRGDVENAEIDLKANYKNLRTSLYPIIQLEEYRPRVPVEPQIKLTGKLFNPIVTFNIYLPNSDENARAYLANAISTQEELSRQFLFLLVMNSFYPENSYRTTQSNSAVSGTTATGTSAVAATTTEMVSNQLSNWLSQISNDFDVGFNYRPGTKELNSQEVQVALSTQLLNDKVMINGNFDVRGAGSPTGYPITGDFDIEYKITDKIRFKVFNRFNNPYYEGHGVPYTQGLGIFFKQDFNKFSDLLNKKVKSEIKKEDEVKVK